MNTVTLTRKTVGVGMSDEAEVAFLVDTSLPCAEPFPGPLQQDWWEFRADSPDEASFIWRTGAQRFLGVAEAVVAGKVTIDQAKRCYLVRRYLDARPDDESEDQGVGEPRGDNRGPEVRVLERALAEQRAVLSTGEDQSFYSGDNDDYLHDAARTLPLPPWARYARGAPGGIASDYVEPLIYLEVGKRLEDLARWIGRWEASPRLRNADLVSGVPFLPFVNGEQQRFRVTPGATQVGAGGRTEFASIFRIASDYVLVEERGFLSMRRLQGGPLKGPAGAALAALVKDVRKGNARMEEFRSGRWRPILRQVQRTGRYPEALKPQRTPIRNTVRPMTTLGIMPRKIDRFREEFSFLSNFHPVPVEYEGITFPTVEHAYQAAKSLDLEVRRSLAALDTPTKAKAKGKRVPLRAGWNDLKLEVMEQLVRAKFAGPELQAMLAATGGAELVEGNPWNDRFWGVCRGTGKNHLGAILMRIRSELATNCGRAPGKGTP